jgi:hypothetical protein
MRPGVGIPRRPARGRRKGSVRSPDVAGVHHPLADAANQRTTDALGVQDTQPDPGEGDDVSEQASRNGRSAAQAPSRTVQDTAPTGIVRARPCAAPPWSPGRTDILRTAPTRNPAS